MSDDLVKQTLHSLEGLDAYVRALDEYNDALVAANEELEAQLREARMQSLVAFGQADEAYKAQLAAEAKLEKAVKALEYYRDYDQNNGYRARAALKELKDQA